MDNISKYKKDNIYKILSFFEIPRNIFLLAIVWTFVILLLTGLPGDSFPKTSQWLDVFKVDKLIHLGMFIPFTLFWLLFLEIKRISNKNAIIIIVMFGIIYGILTEVLQFYVFIGRSANVPDAVADAVGVILGVFIFKIIQSYRFVK